MRAGPAQADRAGLQDDAGDRVQHRPSLETQPRAPLWGHQPGAEPCVRHKAGEEAPPRHLVFKSKLSEQLHTKVTKHGETVSAGKCRTDTLMRTHTSSQPVAGPCACVTVPLPQATLSRAFCWKHGLHNNPTKFLFCNSKA